MMVQWSQKLQFLLRNCLKSIKKNHGLCEPSYFGGRGGLTSVISHISNKSEHLDLQTIFVIKPFLAQAKRSLTVPSFKALAVLFPDFQNLGYVKQHNVALPFL